MFCLTTRLTTRIFLLCNIVFGFMFDGVILWNRNTSMLTSLRQSIKTGAPHATSMDQILAVNLAQDKSALEKSTKKRTDVETSILGINQAKKVVKGLFEGDIIVDPDDPEDAKLLNLTKTGSSHSSQVTLNKRQATRNMKWLWPRKRVPFIISQSLNRVRRNIVKAINTFNTKTCVKFVPKRRKERNYVLFDKRQGCYSRIGRAYHRPGFQVISIGEMCELEGVIIHEMLHAIGFYHEQSRPDRNRNIEIVWENIDPAFQDQFEQYSHGEIDLLQLNYNYNSIMHYGKTAFSKSSNLASMQVIGNNEKNLGNDVMSRQDVIELDALYHCKTKSYNSWTNWGSFSPCDSACYKSRQRFCYGRTHKACGGNPNSYGIEKQYVKCSSQECPAKVHGHWGMWSPWGDCSQRCNEGIKSRTRKCDNPAPKNNGENCKGENTERVLCVLPRCNLDPESTDFRGRALKIWRNDIYDTPGVDWEVWKGATPTEGTGPNGDHTTTKGYYLYIESSNRLRNSVARLVSKDLSKTRPEKKCLKFHYNMFGNTIGSLSVRLFPKGRAAKRIFFVTGNQGNIWKQYRVTLDTDVTFQLAFEGVIGSSPLSDIAIDDVFIDQGSCDCQDEFKRCELWARKGECKKNFKFMFYRCKRSCNYCYCQNSAKWNCNRWSLKECRNNPSWMEVNCPVLCRVCDCYDKHLLCPSWARNNQCTKNPNYMKVYCRKSCNICS